MFKLNPWKQPSAPTPSVLNHVIDYGRVKHNGGHDHRYNRGSDRTVAQLQGDAKRNGSRS